MSWRLLDECYAVAGWDGPIGWDLGIEMIEKSGSRGRR